MNKKLIFISVLVIGISFLLIMNIEKQEQIKIEKEKKEKDEIFKNSTILYFVGNTSLIDCSTRDKLTLNETYCYEYINISSGI